MLQMMVVLFGGVMRFLALFTKKLFKRRPFFCRLWRISMSMREKRFAVYRAIADLPHQHNQIVRSFVVLAGNNVEFLSHAESSSLCDAVLMISANLLRHTEPLTVRCRCTIRLSFSSRLRLMRPSFVSASMALLTAGLEISR